MLVHNLPFYFAIFVSRKMLFVEITICRATLRHSHVSLLINSGFSAFEIGKRVGHSAEKITLRYAHLFPGKQDTMANFLEQERNKSMETGSFSKGAEDQADRTEEEKRHVS